MDCVHNDISQSRYQMPLMSLGVSILAVVAFIIRERKGKKVKT